MAQILICDDDLTFQLACRETLTRSAAYACRWAKNSAEARLLLSKESFDLLLLDIEMRTPDEGLEFLPFLKEQFSELPVLMCSGRSGFEDVRRAMTSGAWDYVRKDCEPEHLHHAVELLLTRARERRNARLAHEEIRRQDARSVGSGEILGNGPAMLELRKKLEKYARSLAPVLIIGETGTGKELVARFLRPIRDDGTPGPFVAVDSATITESTAESILFGHEKGAFTGADRARAGLFEQADGGVLFLDELANMPQSIQQKLLRVLQEKEVTRLGSSRTLKVDFRLIAATNRDLEAMSKKGEFLPDLLQRVQVLPVNLPPLRQRREDIPLLAAEFLRKLGPSEASWSAEALILLQAYDWPGNVRELHNVVHYAVTMADHSSLDVTDLPERIRSEPLLSASAGSEHTMGFYQQMLAHEARLLNEALAIPYASISELARRLGMDRSHLYTKLKQHGLSGK